MLAQSDEGGRSTVRNTCLARRFQAVSYESATSLELTRCAIQRPRALNKTFVPLESKGCDHTSANAPGHIRTPQLSVVGRE